MPPRDWKLRVEDILEAVARIQRYTGGMTFEAFGADEKTLDAVIRNVSIIGEAARHIPAWLSPRFSYGRTRRRQISRSVSLPPSLPTSKVSAETASTCWRSRR